MRCEANVRRNFLLVSSRPAAFFNHQVLAVVAEWLRRLNNGLSPAHGDLAGQVVSRYYLRGWVKVGSGSDRLGLLDNS